MQRPGESVKTMATPAPPVAGMAKALERAEKYLSFRLGKEEFAIKVLSVREIMGMQEVTSVPQTPHYVKGVINLRGKVIPVIDLRLKFGLPAIEYTQRTCIIVVQIEGASGSLSMGAIVDAVSEVLALHAGDIEDAPDFGDGTSAPYILGMAKLKNKVKILLDINMVLTAQEVQKLETALP